MVKSKKVRLPNGSWKVWAQLTSGARIGQAALIEDARYITTVETVSPCTVLSLSRRELINFCERHGLMSPEFSAGLNRVYDRHLHSVALEREQSGEAA